MQVSAFNEKQDGIDKTTNAHFPHFPHKGVKAKKTWIYKNIKAVAVDYSKPE